MSTILPNDFDPRQVAPATGAAGQLPISDKEGHVVIISDDEMKPTNDNTGSYLALILTITEGPHAGGTGVVRLNLNNQSQDAVRIALSELSAICHCVGYLQPLREISALHNRPFRVVVGYQKGKESEGYTEVKKYLKLDGSKPGETSKQGGPASAPPSAPPSASAPTMPPQQQPQGFPQPPQAQQPPQVQNIPFPPPDNGQQQQMTPPPATGQQQQMTPPPMAQTPNPNAAPWAQ